MLVSCQENVLTLLFGIFWLVLTRHIRLWSHMTRRCHDIWTENFDFFDTLVFKHKLFEQVPVTHFYRLSPWIESWREFNQLH